jgi:hypothetical protein
MFGTLFLLIILLNLLISVMGEALSKVLSNIDPFIVREYLQLIVENEMLVDRPKMF